MTEEGKLKCKGRKQLRVNSSERKNRGNTNVLDIQRNPKTKLNLKYNTNRHTDNNYDKTAELLLNNIKNDHMLKNGFFDKLKDNVEVKDNCGPDKDKHKLKAINKDEIKEMVTYKNTSDHISNSLNPLTVLYPRRNRNHKTNKMLVVHNEKNSPQLKTEHKNITNSEPLKQNMQDNFVHGAKSSFEPILKKQMKVIINKKNTTFKHSEDKQQNRHNRGLMSKNSQAQIEAKKRKKQFISKHHMVNELVRKAWTNNSTISKTEFLQSIKEKHSDFANLSQTAENFKRKIKSNNKCNPFHTEIISKRIDACVLNETKNSRISKTPHKMKLREHKKPLYKPSHYAIARKSKKKNKQYNTPNDSLDAYKNKTDYYIVVKKQSNLCGFSASICLQLPHSIDKSCKEDLMKKELTEAAVGNTAQITKYGDGKFSELSDKNPKLLTLLSRTFTIKRNGRDITLNETSKALLSDKVNLLNSAKDKHKSDKSSQRKQKQKKYKFKETYNRKINEVSCFDEKAAMLLQGDNEKSNLKELKESSKQFNKKELNTFVMNKDKDHYHSQTRDNQEMLLNSNRRVFSHKLESCTKLNSKLNTITSKNCLYNEISNILNSEMNVFENKYKEGNKVPIEKENTSISMSSPNWNEKQENNENLSLPQNMEELDYSLKESMGKLVVASPLREEELVINDCSVTNNGILSKSEIENINLCQNNNVGVKTNDVSEIEVQTDVTGDKTIDFYDKLIKKEDETSPMKKDYISIDKYCTQINRSLFNENKTIPSLDRKSFVRIISDKDQLKKEKNIQSEFESISKDSVYNIDRNIEVQGNSYESRNVEFHQENLLSVISENNNTKNEIVNKINTIYEILQNVDKESKSNVLQQQNRERESSNKDEELSILHCLRSNNCSEILIKIKADLPDEMSKNLENLYENKKQLHVFNKRHRFINIIDDDTKKSGCETDLNSKESNNLLTKDVFENKCLITMNLSETQSNHDNMASGEINAEQILQTKPIQILQSIEDSDKQTGYKNKESNHDKIHSVSNNIVECPPPNKHMSTHGCYEKICYNWFEPVTPPTKKRQLFVKIISEEDSSTGINNQEDQISTKSEDFIPFSFGKRFFKQKSLYSKVDHEPLVESVLSSQNLIEKNKYLKACNHQKLNNFYYKLEQGDIGNNTGEKYQYLNSSPLSTTINNCETKDECWESKCKYNEIKQGKNILERRESSDCKISNKLKTQEMSCKDKKSNKNKGLLNSGKQFIKYVCSKSVCNVAVANDCKPEGNIEHKYQGNKRLDTNTFNPNPSVCKYHSIKSNIDKFRKYSNPSKIRNTSNYKNNFRYCSQIHKFDHDTVRSNQSPHIDERKLSVEDEKYENTPSSLIINSTEAVDSFLTKKLSDKYYSSSTESLQQLRDKEKKSWEILEKNSKIYISSPNNIQNNILTNTLQSFCSEDNSLYPMFPSFTKDSKNINDDSLRKVNINSNFKSIASRTDSCDTCSVCSFDSDLNCEPLTKSLTFRNKNITMVSKGSKQCNQNTTNSKINLFKTAAKNQFMKPHKTLSESPILYDDESKIQQIKTNSRLDIKEPFIMKEDKCKSSIGTSSFNFHNKSKTHFNTSRERAQLESKENNKNSDHIKNDKIEGNVTFDVMNNNCDDEWISINKCGFQKSCFAETEGSNLQDNNVGFKMNIKLSDMHIELLCQIPDLNCIDKT